ncbi:MAG: hypothetical protein ACYDCI_03180 [Candidatus Limnocylindrales bacterium]
MPMATTGVSGGRDGGFAVVPFLWDVGDTGSGHLTYRVVDGRIECVGVRLGDSGQQPAADMPTGPQPPLNASLFRALPMGSIIAAGAELVSEQQAFMAELRAALSDFPAIDVEMPAGPTGKGARTPLPVQVIRRGAGTQRRAEGPLAVFAALDPLFEQPKRRVGRPPEHDDAHYREVARRYAEAWSRGDRHPTATVAQQMDAARSTAAKWVSIARQRGFLGHTLPRRAGGVKPSPR